MTGRPRIASLIFEVTQRCNHACLHCYNVWQGPQPDGQPPYPRGECDTARVDTYAQRHEKARIDEPCDHARGGSRYNVQANVA